MFSDLLKRLSGSAEKTPLPELDAKLAVGALLVRIAKSDAHYAVEEIMRIDQFLAHQNQLNPVDAARMRATCEKLEAQAPGIDRFTRMVQDNVSYDARVEVYDALWQVSIADQSVKPVERSFLARAAEAFGISQLDIDAITLRYEP